MSDTGPTTISPQEIDQGFVRSAAAHRPTSDFNPNPDIIGLNPAPDPLAGGGFTRTTDPINPQEDPRFREFLRRQGASNAAARAAIAKRLAELEKSRVRREEDFGRQVEDIDIAGFRGDRSIVGDFEQRGLFGSGRQLRGQEEFAGDIGRQRGDAERMQNRFLEDLQEAIAEIEARRGKIGAGQGAARNRLAEQIRREIILDRARQRIVTDFR